MPRFPKLSPAQHVHTQAVRLRTVPVTTRCASMLLREFLAEALARRSLRCRELCDKSASDRTIRHLAGAIGSGLRHLPVPGPQTPATSREARVVFTSGREQTCLLHCIRPSAKGKDQAHWIVRLERRAASQHQRDRSVTLPATLGEKSRLFSCWCISSFATG